MVVNAAGGLLPSLALELRDCFEGAAVLPSYGQKTVFCSFHGNHLNRDDGVHADIFAAHRLLP